MDVITFARDRGAASNASYGTLQINPKHMGMSNSQSSFNKFQNLQTSSLSSGISNYGMHQNIPGVSMKHLLALTKKKESCKKSPNRISKSKCLKENHQYVKCEKRSLLQIPDSPKDPKLLKSNLSRGSWPGPGIENPGSLLESSFSKSEQHLNVVGQESFTICGRKYSGSDCSASSHYVTVQSASNSSITSHSGGKSIASADRDVMTSEYLSVCEFEFGASLSLLKYETCQVFKHSPDNDYYQIHWKNILFFQTSVTDCLPPEARITSCSHKDFGP